MSEPADWPNAALANCMPWLSKGTEVQMASLIRWQLRKLLLSMCFMGSNYGQDLVRWLHAVTPSASTNTLTPGTARIPLIDSESSAGMASLFEHS